MYLCYQKYRGFMDKARFSQEDIAIKKSPNALIVKNNSKESISIDVNLLGNKAFHISDKHKKIKILPNGYARIPFSFREKKIGWPIADYAERKAVIQLWHRDPNSKYRNLLRTVIINAGAPVYVRELNCIEPVVPEQSQKRGNSPPVITIQAVKPGTNISKNTGTIRFSWEITGAGEITEMFTHPGAEVLEPGTFTDESGEGCYGCDVSASGSYELTVGGTNGHYFEARNADGTTYDGETFYSRARIGYHNARCPAGGTVHTDELDTLREWLEEIEARISSNALADLPGFIEDWNDALSSADISAAEREAYTLPSFDNMDYLSGRVGTHNLADDLLSAMHDVLIYIKPYTLPRGYRPMTLPADRHAICDEWACNGGTCRKYGSSYCNEGNPDCRWISLCLEQLRDATGLTLLHELYHYTVNIVVDPATTEGREIQRLEELRAVAVSCCCYDFIAPADW